MIKSQQLMLQLSPPLLPLPSSLLSSSRLFQAACLAKSSSASEIVRSSVCPSFHAGECMTLKASFDIVTQEKVRVQVRAQVRVQVRVQYAVFDVCDWYVLCGCVTV